MARLPTPGSDKGTWGNILNDYLSQSLNSSGSIKPDAISTSQLADNSVTSAQIAPNAVDNAAIASGAVAESQLTSGVQTKLNAQAPVQSVAGKTGTITLVKSDVGLSNVDNTADTAKPVSTATQTALDLKLDTTDLDSQTADKITTDGSATQVALNAAFGTALDAVITESGATEGQVATYDTALGKYKPSTAVSGGGSGSTPGFLWDLMFALETNNSSLNVIVAGDSVSNEITEWAGLLAGKLGVRYPAFTVKVYTWTGSAYSAATTLQTGTGANTLYFYLASVSGVASGYSTDPARFATMYAPIPDVVLIATGHNDSGVQALEKTIRDQIVKTAGHYNNTAIGVVLVNPEAAADAGYQTMFTSERIIVRVAGEQGVGVLNLMHDWVTRSGGYADLMLDTVHPNSAGHEFLAATAFQQMVGVISGSHAPAVRRETVEDLFIPIHGAIVVTGSPAPAVIASGGTGWGMVFDPAADEAVYTPAVQIPWWFSRYTIDVLWAPQANGGGDVRFRIDTGYYAPGSAATLATGSGATTTVAQSTTAGKVLQSRLFGSDSVPFLPPNPAHHSAGTFGPTYPQYFKVSRLGSDVLDTYASDVLVVGLVVSRGRRY